MPFLVVSILVVPIDGMIGMKSGRWKERRDAWKVDLIAIPLGVTVIHCLAPLVQ